jgi:hypothetical protein
MAVALGRAVPAGKWVDATGEDVSAALDSLL